MIIGRVIGELVSTQKHSTHENLKILLVQPLNLDGSERGDALVAVDSVQAGVGQTVLLATDGYAAFSSVGLPPSPIDMAVVGIIDRIDLSA
ncbi:MAG: EutN/CcmL family microcompartment protein [Bryobacteraceae bacterium]|nr:EutN/CcmL family microcompartment protein [Bryobacteraceae bacterium]